jgi:tetratricopeptide (TPR) repeat protein
MTSAKKSAKANQKQKKKESLSKKSVKVTNNPNQQIQELIHDGTKFMSRIDYIHALESFTQGLQIVEKCKLDESVPQKMLLEIQQLQLSLLYHRAGVYLQCHEYQHAINDMEELLANSEQKLNRQALAIKARALFRMRKYDESIQVYLECLHGASDHVLTKLNRQLKQVKIAKMKSEGVFGVDEQSDVLSILPDEIFHEIVLFLPVKDIVCSISLSCHTYFVVCDQNELWLSLSNRLNPEQTQMLVERHKCNTAQSINNNQIVQLRNWKYFYRLFHQMPTPTPIRNVLFNPTKRISNSQTLQIHPLYDLEAVMNQIHEQCPTIAKEFPECIPSHFFYVTSETNHKDHIELISFNSLLIHPYRYNKYGSALHIVLTDSSGNDKVGYCVRCRFNVLKQTKCSIAMGHEKSGVHKFVV